VPGNLCGLGDPGDHPVDVGPRRRQRRDPRAAFGSPHASYRAHFACPGFRITLLFVETIKGKPVTEQDIQDWADEAERGYDVEQLRKRGRKPIGDGPAQVVPVRIDATLLAALSERAERDHVSRSEAIRAAIRSYVA
jgi:hypothetical protein